jgi:protein involved in polysaccharide export with SLBB domain
MKFSRIMANRLFAILGGVTAGLLLAGCQTQSAIYERVDEVPGDDPRMSSGKSPVFQIGDEVTIVFSPADSLQPHTESVKEDGTITPPQVGKVIALGKLPGQLQKELQEKYERLFVNMTVTVLSKDRYYYVSGEVRRPGATPYLGQTDIIKAVSSAGDCTDFAKRKRIQLTRANGQKEIIDFEKAIQDQRYNVPVYPGDKIVVPRKLW